MLVSHRSLAAAACAAALSCSERERPPPFDGASGASGGGTTATDGGIHIDIDAEVPSFCGIHPSLPICANQAIPAIDDPPNLYFVIDASGSMGAGLPGSAHSKYTNARVAVSHLLDTVGHRVRYGAAVFPAYEGNTDGCAPGSQIFETTRGDPLCRELPGRGPTLQGLLTQLEFVALGGGTPIATSLAALTPTLTALTGETWVVLITDGAPNCNLEASCGSDACIPNIEHFSYADIPCSDAFNCCDPANLGPNAGGNCVDADESERAVADLEAAGIPTFVIGMPGSEPYADLLDRLAVAGGTARAEPPYYYSTHDTASLAQALIDIGTGVAIKCAIPLAAPPPDPDLVNVYFDGELVVYDEADGWAWTSEESLEIRGQACERLRSGGVFEVQILAGCETVVL